MKHLLVFFMLLLLSCAEDGKDGTNGTNGSDGSIGTDGTSGSDGADSTTDTRIVYNLSGNLQKGPCLKDGNILIQPLDDGSLNQLGTHFIGFTKDNYGYYEIPAEITELYAEVFFEGDCHNEVTGGSGTQKLSGIIKVTDIEHNINPLTKISSQVTRWLFDDGFGTIEASIIEAERLILLYLGMPALTNRFTEMNLEEDSTHDAVLALSSSMILYGRAEAEQGDYIVSIANGVISDDLTLKAEIASTIDVLPLMQIKNNLETRYSELGMSIDMPPIWNLGAPSYYNDLLTRTPVVTGTFNLDDTGHCMPDKVDNNILHQIYAIPHTFDSIENSRYIALNLTGDISIWTSAMHASGHLAPGTKVLDITQLREIILDSNLAYNGFLGDSHGLTNGTDYYIVVERDESFYLTKGCGVENVGTFTLHSDDDMLNWYGDGVEKEYYNYSGVKILLTD